MWSSMLGRFCLNMNQIRKLIRCGKITFDGADLDSTAVDSRDGDTVGDDR